MVVVFDTSINFIGNSLMGSSIRQRIKRRYKKKKKIPGVIKNKRGPKEKNL